MSVWRCHLVESPSRPKKWKLIMSLRVNDDQHATLVCGAVTYSDHLSFEPIETTSHIMVSTSQCEKTHRAVVQRSVGLSATSVKSIHSVSVFHIVRRPPHIYHHYTWVNHWDRT
jgi:hypothetical protein